MGQLSDVQRRGHRIDAFASSVQNGDLEETLDRAMSADDEFATLDGIMAVAETAKVPTTLSLSQVTMDMINAGTDSHFPVMASDIDAMLSAAKMVGESSLVTMDGIQSVEGSGVIASAVALNQYIIKNSQVGGLIGNISDMEMVGKTNDKNVKFKVYSMLPRVITGMGDLVDGERITPLNATRPMMNTKRVGKLITVDDVTTYTFNVEAKSGGGNYPIAHGVTSVILGDTGRILEDENAGAQEDNPVRETTINGGQVKMTVNKSAGTVVLEVSEGALPVGTVMFVETALSLAKKSEIRGTVGVEIEDFTYVANGVIGGTKVDVMDARQVSQQLSHGLLAGGLSIVANKQVSENLGFALSMASAFARQTGTPIDLKLSNGLATTAEAYKQLPVAIDTAAVEINTESQLTDKVIVVGGMGLLEAFNMLAKNTDGMNVRDTNDANGVKFLGYLDGKYPAFYNPTFDAAHPLLDANGEIDGDTPSNNVYHTLEVFGTPSDPSKRLIISGTGLPIIPVDFKINTDSEKGIALEGKTVLAVNKDPMARKLAKKILFSIA